MAHLAALVAAPAIPADGPPGEGWKACLSMDFLPALPRVMLPLSKGLGMPAQEGGGAGRGAMTAP